MECRGPHPGQLQHFRSDPEGGSTSGDYTTNGDCSFSILVLQCKAQKGPDITLVVPPEQLKDDKFDALYHSPLARADQTAQIVWGSRSGPVTVLPSLREIDLYSFQVAALLWQHLSHLACAPQSNEDNISQ